MPGSCGRNGRLISVTMFPFKSCSGRGGLELSIVSDRKLRTQTNRILNLRKMEPKKLLALWRLIAYLFSRNLQLPILTRASYVGGGSHGHHTVAMAF